MIKKKSMNEIRPFMFIYIIKARFHVATFIFWRVFAILKNVPIFWSNYNLNLRCYGQLFVLVFRYGRESWNYGCKTALPNADYQGNRYNILEITKDGRRWIEPKTGLNPFLKTALNVFGMQKLIFFLNYFFLYLI